MCVKPYERLLSRYFKVSVSAIPFFVSVAIFSLLVKFVFVLNKISERTLTLAE